MTDTRPRTITLTEGNLRILLSAAYSAGMKSAVGANGISYRTPDFDEVVESFADDSWTHVPTLQMTDEHIRLMKLIGPHRRDNY